MNTAGAMFLVVARRRQAWPQSWCGRAWMPERFPEEKMMRMLARVALAVAALALTPVPPAAAAGDPPVAKRAAVPSRGFAGIPAKACRPGFTQAGPQLCVMEVARGPASFANAVLDCMDLGAR